MVTARVTGQMILDALEFGCSFLPKRDGGFPQTSGMTYTINQEIPTSVKMDERKQFISVDGERRVSDVKIGDEDLDPNGSYTIAITQYLLTGGNGFTMFDGAEILTDPRLADNEVVVKYIEENLKGKIPDMYEKPLGRIKWKTA
jgi:2',3'-cyclic-nucleotide 2'-phosphodiesterase (5'-nucleotidase family)